ncbi:MAG: OB-fold domain-containing protein [Desulfobacterium sp.]
MSDKKNRKIPAVDGWFTMPPEEPRVIASKCSSCGDVFFPPGGTCRNPDCSKEGSVDQVRLSRVGKLETFAINYYPPPPPYRKADPFVPFGIAAVGMPEGLLIKAQVAAGFEKNLKVGMDMEVVVEVLYVDDQGKEVLVHKFKPIE